MGLIHEYIKKADTASIKLEIENNPSSINQKDERDFPAIVLATYAQNSTITQLLIDAGVEIDQKDRAGNTALMGVTYKGNLEIVEMLIEAGADVNAINFAGATPLIYAAMFGQVDIAKILLQKGANKTLKDADGKSAMDHSKEKENTAMIDILS